MCSLARPREKLGIELSLELIGARRRCKSKDSRSLTVGCSAKVRCSQLLGFTQFCKNSTNGDALLSKHHFCPSHIQRQGKEDTRFYSLRFHLHYINYSRRTSFTSRCLWVWIFFWKIQHMFLCLVIILALDTNCYDTAGSKFFCR